MENAAKQNIEQSISNTNQDLDIAVQKYIETVESGSPHITLLCAHKTCSEANASLEIEDTSLYKNDPGIKLKFGAALKKEMEEERDKICIVLRQLDNISFTIIQQCDKVWNVFRSLQDNLSFKELTQGSFESFPIVRKIEAFDIFKKKFHDDHSARKYSFNYCNTTGHINKLLQFWNISDLKKAHNDLQCVIIS